MTSTAGRERGGSAMENLSRVLGDVRRSRVFLKWLTVRRGPVISNVLLQE